MPGATSFDADGTCCSIAEARFPNQTVPEDKKKHGFGGILDQRDDMRM